jgi:hypothetical protein
MTRVPKHWRSSRIEVLREKVAQIHYQYALPSQCAIAVLVRVPTAITVQLSSNVKAIHDQPVKLTRAALYKLGSILTKNLESGVIAQNKNWFRSAMISGQISATLIWHQPQHRKLRSAQFDFTGD